MTKKEIMNELNILNVKFNKDSKKEELEKLYNEAMTIKVDEEEIKEEVKEEVKTEEAEKKEEVKEAEKKEEVKKDNFAKCVANITLTSEMILDRMKDNSVAVKHETTNQKTRKKVVLYRVYASNRNNFRVDTTIEDIFKNLTYETHKKSASVYYVIKNLTAEKLQEVTKQMNENASKYIFK